MRKPCPKCPFRRDVAPYLRPARAAQIARGIADGGEFPCHNTTVHNVTEDGDEVLVDDPQHSQFCAGALATMHASGMPNQMLRIAQRMGMYDPAQIERYAVPLVYGSLGEWAASFRDDVQYAVEDGVRVPFEHCGIVGEDCEDPAGYQGMGHNPEPGTLDPTDADNYCEDCGRAGCPACRSHLWDDDGRFCVTCINEEEA
jgi:hypothetical protein